MNNELPKVTAYTDGSCQGNPGPGGWGVVLQCAGYQKHLNGKSKGITTNNSMELVAAIEALKALNRKARVVIYSDSQYVVDGASTYIKRWKRNNWKTSAGRGVKNKELWQHLDSLMQQHEVQFVWIRGHNGDTYNELADKLAREF